MDKLKEAIASIKKPLEASLRDPSQVEHLGEIEKAIHSAFDRVAQGRPFRFSVEMMIWDLRNELRGFERFDGSNKSVLIENCYRILGRLEALTEREDGVFLQESEIAEEMKAQAALDIAEAARREQRSRRDTRQQRSAPAPRTERDPGRPTRSGGNDRAAAAKPADEAQDPSKPSRRRRRSRRKRKPPKPDGGT